MRKIIIISIACAAAILSTLPSCTNNGKQQGGETTKTEARKDSADIQEGKEVKDALDAVKR
jgi:hypothetical protein